MAKEKIDNDEKDMVVDDDDDDDGSNNYNDNNDDDNTTENNNDEDEDKKADDNDDDGSNDDDNIIDDDEDFKSSTVFIYVSNESESLLCDTHERTDYKCSLNLGHTESVIYGNEILNRSDSEINDHESYYFSETLRRRNVFIKDEGYLLNTDIFFPVEIGGIDDLIIYPKNEELSTLYMFLMK